MVHPSAQNNVLILYLNSLIKKYSSTFLSVVKFMVDKNYGGNACLKLDDKDLFSKPNIISNRVQPLIN